MTINVETGSGLDPAANSYVTLAAARLQAALLGLTLPTLDADAEKALMRGLAYIDSQAPRLQGRIAVAVQPLQWPRAGMLKNGNAIPASTIPLDVIKAQITAAFYSSTGVDFFPKSESKFVIEDTVDVLTTKYSDKVFGNSTGIDTYPEIETYLLPYMKASSGYRLTHRQGF